MSDELSVVSKWFVRGTPPKNPKGRLILFHPMGVGASFFGSFIFNSPDEFDTIAVQLPGRETRIDEDVPTQVPEIVAGIMSDIGEVGVGDVFWGHSFGGIIAFETLKALQRQGSTLPRLMVTGTIAPHLACLWQKRDVLLQLMADDYSPDFLLAVSRYVEDASLVRSLLAEMRKDMAFLATYKHDAGDKVLNTSITAFAARQDDMVYADEIEPWESYTEDFKLVEVDGDHWFLQRNQALLRKTLEDMAMKRV